MVEPIDGAILQIGEGIVTCRAGELVLGEHHLLLPRIGGVRRVGGGFAVFPVAALHGLTAIPPRGYATGVDDLSLDVKATDQEPITLIFQVLEYRARVLSHQDGVRWVVMNAELVTDTMLLADSMKSDPGTRRVRDVVVPSVERVPPRHRALLDAVGEAACLGLLEQGDELLLEHDEVLIHLEPDVAADETAHCVCA